jgi:hypothetical protein
MKLPPVLKQNKNFIPVVLLTVMVGVSAILAFVPAFKSEVRKWNNAMYEGDRVIFTTYFYWYQGSNSLSISHQIYGDANSQAVKDTIEQNIQELPKGWPGPTELNDIVSINATGDGNDFFNQVSHVPLAVAPTYNNKGEVNNSVDEETTNPIRDDDDNGIMYNITDFVSWNNELWHEWEFRNMMRAGIDVAMPVYWWTGPVFNQNQWAIDGLITMNDTLTNLTTKVATEHDAGGKYSVDDVPKLSMFFDTTCMRQMWATYEASNNESEYYGDYTAAWDSEDGPDLTDPYWENQFYERIYDFYSVLINGDNYYSTEITVDGETNEYLVVWLYGSNWFSDIGDSINYCKQEFEDEFDKKLVFVGGDAWVDIGADGLCGWGACCGIHEPGYSKIPVGGYGPGYYNLGAINCQGASYIPRDVERYKDGLQKIIDLGAVWIHIETWNELLEGTDICWTYETGYEHIDATREIADEFHAMAGEFPSLTTIYNFPLMLIPLFGFVGILYYGFKQHKNYEKSLKK